MFEEVEHLGSERDEFVNLPEKVNGDGEAWSDAVKQEARAEISFSVTYSLLILDWVY